MRLTNYRPEIVTVLPTKPVAPGKAYFRCHPFSTHAKKGGGGVKPMAKCIKLTFQSLYKEIRHSYKGDKAFVQGR